MAKQTTTPMTAKGKPFEKVIPANDPKKTMSVRQQSGRVGKVGLKGDIRKLDTKLKTVDAIRSESIIDVTKKVVTNAEACFNCPSADCDHVVIRYRNLFDHFSDHCKPEGYQTFRWWCDKCEIPRYWLMGSDLVRHGQEIHNLTDADWPADLTFPHNFCHGGLCQLPSTVVSF